MSYGFNHAQRLVFVLLMVFSAGWAHAQVVDPCRYGCPKEGCPKCDKGGPIGKAVQEPAAASKAPDAKPNVRLASDVVNASSASCSKTCTKDECSISCPSGKAANCRCDNIGYAKCSCR